MGISMTQVRAVVTGGGVSASTPNVLSIYVRYSRNELCSFSCSVKVGGDSVGSGMISASINGTTVFTGIITSAHSRPCFDDPTYCIIDITGTDVRKQLENKTFTRRCTDSESSWALITGVVRQGLKSSKLAFRPRANLGGAFYTSPDQFQKGDAQSTSMVKDYLNQSSGQLIGSGKSQSSVVPYAYIRSSVEPT